MKTVRHTTAARDRVLHVETEGCVVNIEVGLFDDQDRPVTSVRILPDDVTRGGDGKGRLWELVDASRVVMVGLNTQANQQEQRDRLGARRDGKQPYRVTAHSGGRVENFDFDHYEQALAFGRGLLFGGGNVVAAWTHGKDVTTAFDEQLAPSSTAVADSSERTTDADWWEASYRITGSDGVTLQAGTVEVMADDEQNARYHANLSDEAQAMGTGQAFVIDSVRKL